MNSPAPLVTADQLILTKKQEAFCVAYVASGDASRCYREAFDCSPTIAGGTVRKRAHDLMHSPKVRQRIRALQAAAAESTVISVRQQMVDLDAMSSVDVSELWRLEYRPCDACTKLYDADLVARRPMPDLSDGLPPHPSCRDVRAHQHVVMLPMDQWPPAARRLYEGTTVDKDGVLRPVFASRIQLRDMLLKTLGAYVSRSENITAHVTVDPNKPNPWSGATLTPAQVLERVLKSRAPAPVAVIEQAAPVEATP